MNSWRSTDWLIVAALAAAPLSCARDESDQALGTAAARIVSASFAVAAAPVDPGFRLSVNWQCGVGLVAWAEPTAIGSHVVAVRFDADGNALDPTPFVVLDVPNTTTNVSSVMVERAVDGFQIGVLRSTSSPFPGSSASAYPVGLNGTVGSAFFLGGVSAVPPASATLNLWRGGFDGERSYFVTGSVHNSGDFPFLGSPASLTLIAAGVGVVAGDNGIFGLDSNSPMFRGFGCGEGGCLLLTTRRLGAFSTQHEDIDRLIVDGAVAAAVTQPASIPPVTGSGDVFGTGCGFLVVDPSESRVVDSTPALLAGPQALAGAGGAPYRAFNDGVDARIYWSQSGLQSAVLDASGQPSATAAEDAAFADAAIRLASVGDGRAVQVYYEAGEVRVRFLGSNALVPVEGHCGGELDGDTGGAVCPSLIGATCDSAPDCFSGFCVDGVCCDTACDGSCDVCAASAGASADGVCSPASGVACDDGDSCSQVDVCQAGVCVGSDPVVDGTPCEDDDACSQTSTCQAGTCIAATPMPDGTSCDDGMLCSTASACQGGVCQPSAFVSCEPTNDCREATCVETTGLCEEVPKLDGSACDAPCLTSEACLEGECVGVQVVCVFDQCHAPGTCDPELDACTESALADGTSCTSDNPCAEAAQCQAGVCVDTTLLECQPLGLCDAPFCEDGVGCMHAPQPDGSPCPGGACSEGTCVEAADGGASAAGGAGGADGAAGGAGGGIEDPTSNLEGAGCSGCVSAGRVRSTTSDLLLAAVILMVGRRRRSR